MALYGICENKCLVEVSPKTETDAEFTEINTAINNRYTKSETDELLNAKANSADVYNKTEIDNKTDAIDSAIVTKANSADVYNKTEIDTAFMSQHNAIITKANSADVYNKTEIDNKTDAIDNHLDNIDDALDNRYTKSETNNLLNAKANSADVYNKTEIDTAFMSQHNAIITKANSADVYNKTEIDTAFRSQHNAIITKANSADVYNKTETYTKAETDAVAASYSSYYTFVVDSQAKFDLLVSNAAGYDYSSVLIKHGNYTMPTTGQISTAKVLVGEGGRYGPCINITLKNNSSSGAYLLDVDIIEGLVFNITNPNNVSSSIFVFSGCCNINACTFNANWGQPASDNTSLFYSSAYITNCRFTNTIATTGKLYLFMNCSYISNCNISGVTLTTTRSPFKNCSNISGCSVSCNRFDAYTGTFGNSHYTYNYFAND